MLVRGSHILLSLGACLANAVPNPTVTERHDEFGGEVGIVERKYVITCFKYKPV